MYTKLRLYRTPLSGNPQQLGAQSVKFPGMLRDFSARKTQRLPFLVYVLKDLSPFYQRKDTRLVINVFRRIFTLYEPANPLSPEIRITKIFRILGRSESKG
jgi:hypothetical protein